MQEVRKLMRTHVITVPLEETVERAAQRMTEHHVGAVVVLEEGKVAGMFTERDVLDRVVSAGRSPSSTTVAEVCTRAPMTVGEQTPVLECYALILEHGFRHLPVTDGGGRPVGMVSARDFFAALALRSEPELDIAEVCAQLGRMSALMAEIERLPC